MFELIAEKYKERRWEAGVKVGRQEGRQEERQAWQNWYERQQTALREGRPFNEPPPGYSDEAHDNGDSAKESP